jgi:hypothetical protein
MLAAVSETVNLLISFTEINSLAWLAVASETSNVKEGELSEVDSIGFSNL